MTARLVLKLTIAGSALFLSSCASIFNGRNQTVEITSHPPGASVRINGSDTGKTPLSAELSRKISHRVELDLKGYKPYETVLAPEFNGAAMGNILGGGIIGMVVDGSTGAGNTLNPKSVEARLEKR
ncbi:MAG: PEGA domain-containing protein [Luteolibacter sp.]